MPAGVMASQIDKNHILYLNVSGEPKEIQINRTREVSFLIKTTPAILPLHPMSRNLLKSNNLV